MFESLQRLDQQLLLWFNGKHTAFFDGFMFIVSDKYVWIPFYMILAGILIYRYRWKSLWIFLSVIILIVLSDQTANVLKEGIKRFRPCKDPEIGFLVHIVNDYCRSSYGFVSGHAANSFALATFLSLLFRNRWATIGLLIWAAVVSYSRIYLGVHYPGDVLGGAFLGAFIAGLVYAAWKQIPSQPFGGE
jgi:undecaprenyl-diphosphatase